MDKIGIICSGDLKDRVLRDERLNPKLEGIKYAIGHFLDILL